MLVRLVVGANHGALLWQWANSNGGCEMTIKCRVLIGAFLASLLVIPGAYAGPAVDFSTIGGSNPHGATASLDGVTITAFVNGFAAANESNLWLRTDGVPENGLGVCSEGTSACNSGGGDVNELSNNADNTEWIVLTRPADMEWTGLWVGSLDNNGGSAIEKGTVYWSNTLGDLTNGSAFNSTQVSGASGDIIGLLSGFDPFANYLMFRAGPGTENNPFNNDYLVWGVDLTSCAPNCPGTENVPEPVTLSLFGVGLAGAVAIRRRRKVAA